jgi:hypothetical protein
MDNRRQYDVNHQLDTYNIENLKRNYFQRK